MILLKEQSKNSDKYKLFKDESLGLYYIRRKKDGKTVLIGDKEKADNFIIYGLDEMKEEITELFAKEAKENEN